MGPPELWGNPAGKAFQCLHCGLHRSPSDVKQQCCCNTKAQIVDFKTDDWDEPLQVFLFSRKYDIRKAVKVLALCGR